MPTPASLSIIYQDRDIAILNKPAGLLVHSVPGRIGKEPTLVDFLLSKFPSLKTVGDNPIERPGLVHRLDRDTSGILLVALTQPAFEYFKNLFQTRAISKTYLAVVLGIPKQSSGQINAPIGIKSGTVRRSVYSKKMSKPALTDYRLLGSFLRKNNNYSLLLVCPHTGRTHQVRVHLSSLGYPVIGDVIYNKRSPWSRLLLHAFSLEFTHLNGRRFKFAADPPENFLSFSPSLPALIPKN